MLKVPLAKKIIGFLKKEKEIEMSAIYQFDLQRLTLMDVASDDMSDDSEE